MPRSLTLPDYRARLAGRLPRKFSAALLLPLLLWWAPSAGAQVAVRLPDTDLDTLSVTYIDGKVWLATTGGAYRIDGNAIARVPDVDLVVYSVTKIGGSLWLGTTSGAYRLTDGVLKRIPDQDLIVHSVKEVGGKPWLSTTRGAYRVDGDAAVRIPDQSLVIRGIEYIDGRVWLATSGGAYRVDGDDAQRIPDQHLDVLSIKQAGGSVWIGTHTGAFRVEGESVRRFPDQDLDVVNVKYLNGEVWLATHTGAYRINGDSVARVPDQDLIVENVELIDGVVWLATHTGAYRLEGEHVTRVPEQGMIVLNVRGVNGKVWLTTPSGAYLVNGHAVKRVPDLDLTVRRIEAIDGRAWMPTNNGTYRIDEDVTITVRAQSKDSWWRSTLEWLLPGNVWVAGTVRPGVAYSRAGAPGDPYPSSMPRRFAVIMETDPNVRSKSVAERRFSPADDFERTLSSGKTTLYTSVRDSWGNQFENEEYGFVVPGPAILPVLTAAAWLTLLAAALYFAPLSTFCHDLLMNPWLRKYGSFGLVPLAMSVIPAVRRHILRRYTRAIEDDPAFSAVSTNFVVPSEQFRPEGFLATIEHRRKMLLLGQSGIGKTSYFRFLTFSLAAGRVEGAPRSGMVPIFLPLARYQGETVETIFHAQLSNFGRLSDQELTSWLLRQGGFLLLIDGLNEVNEQMRNKVTAFVDQHWKANCLCVSSQDDYPELTGLDKESLAPLGPEQIREILKRRLGEEKMQSVVGPFTARMYDTYRIPQDLDFAVELIRQGHPVPTSKHRLYESVLSPLMNGWVTDGWVDYPELLYQRAYEMLSSHNTYFDGGKPPLPDSLRDRLVEKKFLVRRGEHYHFRHDLVRAYLASRFFAPRWQSLLFDRDTALDVNWRPMLEFFVLSNPEPEIAKNLLYSVLVKNKSLAGDLFKWLNQTQPGLCAGWADEFKRRYGEMMLN